MYSYPHKTAYGSLESIDILPYLSRAECPDLYFHVPFCSSKCGYCNLFSVAGLGEECYIRYTDALCRQFQGFGLSGRSFRSLTIGGGTPLILPEGQLERILSLAMGAGNETTSARAADFRSCVETAPSEVTRAKLRILKDFQVERISLGVQSMHEAELAALGRVQDVSGIRSALEQLKLMDFPCINVDLIYGIPGQDVRSFYESLKMVLEYEPDEIFIYPLYIREGTVLYEQRKNASNVWGAYAKLQSANVSGADRGAYAKLKSANVSGADRDAYAKLKSANVSGAGRDAYAKLQSANVPSADGCAYAELKSANAANADRYAYAKLQPANASSAYSHANAKLQSINAANTEANAGMYSFARDMLVDAGYAQLSMRQFAKKASATPKSCGLDDMIGIGCGARSYLGDLHFCSPFALGRERCIGLIEDYMRESGSTAITNGYILNEDERKRRFVIKNLMYYRGLSVRDYQELFQRDPVADFPILDWLRECGLVDYEDSAVAHICLTSAGMGLSDFIGPMFISDQVNNRMRAWRSKGYIRRK